MKYLQETFTESKNVKKDKKKKIKNLLICAKTGPMTTEVSLQTLTFTSWVGLHSPWNLTPI